MADRSVHIIQQTEKIRGEVELAMGRLVTLRAGLPPPPPPPEVQASRGFHYRRKIPCSTVLLFQGQGRHSRRQAGSTRRQQDGTYKRRGGRPLGSTAAAAVAAATAGIQRGRSYRPSPPTGRRHTSAGPDGQRQQVQLRCSGAQPSGSRSAAAAAAATIPSSGPGRLSAAAAAAARIWVRPRSALPHDSGTSWDTTRTAWPQCGTSKVADPGSRFAYQRC
jgi:hypothetical protein